MKKSRRNIRRAEKSPKVHTLQPQTRKPRPGTGEMVQLTVRGVERGQLRMAADDGAIYLCGRQDSRGVLDGDRVEAERVGREHVRVMRVIEHAHAVIVGVLRIRPSGTVIEPLERHLPSEIAASCQTGVSAKDGDIVRAEVERWQDQGGMLVRVSDVIGSFTQATAALDGLIVSSHLRAAFDARVLAEAEALPDARLEDDSQREDLRGLLTFTIDGRDAKDFDDAVSLEPLSGGGLRLGVHIADVGHYVREGTALDREAFLRGTSVYFPGRVLPMLPERLSNGVCSLRPDEDKFTLSAMMDMTREGEVVSARVARTITRSKARLVYDDVNSLFDGDEEQSRSMAEKHALIPGTLQAMRDLSHAIRARREAKGAIDFAANEPEFVLDETGEPAEIMRRERGDAERMIEDFMLTANEAVARFARERRIPLLYRVHEKPDPEKLAVFKAFLDGIGVDSRGLTGEARPADIRAILESTRERPEYTVISALALRSMQKARYDAQPLGHYGLAMPDYCHFTSPIRRYPDLVVSRALTAGLTGGQPALAGDRLADAAIRSSDCERAAIEAERAADRIMTARLMASHVGEEFDGVVSGMSEYGLYVLLQNGAEGFLHVRSLNDWFEFDARRMTLRGERTGARFSLGQALHVRVENVELTSSSVELGLVEELSQVGRSERKRERERMRGFRR
ncbi:MAG: ribonuclease R [Clostridia bacterium]|nr:ribonuclease R [Clostridia bacterium]